MKIVIAILLTGFLAYVTGVYSSLPWWSFVVTSLLVSVAIHQRPGKAFLCGFFGVFFLWAGMAVIKDAANNHILSTKVANLFPLGGSYLALILVTGIVGGLVSGLAALAGSYLRR